MTRMDQMGNDRTQMPSQVSVSWLHCLICFDNILGVIISYDYLK